MAWILIWIFCLNFDLDENSRLDFSQFLEARISQNPQSLLVKFRSHYSYSWNFTLNNSNEMIFIFETYSLSGVPKFLFHVYSFSFFFNIQLTILVARNKNIPYCYTLQTVKTVLIVSISMWSFDISFLVHFLQISFVYSLLSIYGI